MNIKYAYELLNLDISKKLDIKILKQHYHFLALKYHPDKNHDINSNNIFREINEAYNLLLNLENNIIKEEKQEKYENIINFDELLSDFIKLLNIKNVDDSSVIINYFKEKYENYNCIILDKLSDTNYFKELINTFNNHNYKNLIIINTDIKNILNDEIYKLDIENEIVYIPLWYKDIIYKNNLIKIKLNNKDYIIDDNNNIYLEKYVKIKDLINKDYSFYIGNKYFSINNNLLYFKTEHEYIFYNSGIIRSENIVEDISYIEDNSILRSNIYLKLFLK